ncbi:patatin-like phospholipase family protein [Methyloceanibacter sp.]|jgi:NTE family protein|uniref:patatin-like phospholipase family protein n=1 Tax=Methyloceanibacter sp. TaxID=1965321 RepID=UPI002B800C84|nr:patatin-like phospholipase family protein [Methyloceanibacter sp.]
MSNVDRPKIGIALGGGAARGWAHIGVLNSLVEAGLEPDIVAGTSIGAVAGACYVTGRLKALEDFAASLTRRRVFGFLDVNFGGSGLITGQRLSARLEHHLAEHTIEGLDRRFVAVATELGTGHEVWLNKGSLVNALKASFALPGIFRPVKINGRWLIDGALVNPIPVSVCRALGARIVIAVNLSCDLLNKGGVIHDQANFAEPAGLLDDQRLPGSNGRAALHLLHRQIFGRSKEVPGISSVMMDAINITQDRIARSRLAGDPPDISIAPKTGHIGLFEFHRAGEAMALGARAAEKQIDEIKMALSAFAA